MSSSLVMRLVRFMAGGVLAAGLATMYATGFAYTPLAHFTVGTAWVVGFGALLLPYPLGVSGKFSIQLMLISLVIGTALFGILNVNLAMRVEGNVLVEFWLMITEPGFARYSLPVWAILLGGSCLIGGVLPARQHLQT
jgi:hypothetical protein